MVLMVSHDVMNNLYEAFVVPDLLPYAITSKNKNSYVSIDQGRSYLYANTQLCT